MNDDPSLSSAAPAGEPNRNTSEGGATGSDRTRGHDGDRPETSQSRERSRRKRRSRKKRNPGLKKKLEFVTHMLKGVDGLVLAELSALYYMEYGDPQPARVKEPGLIITFSADAHCFIFLSARSPSSCTFLPKTKRSLSLCRLLGRMSY